jgi:hypothetical protein
MAKIAAQAEALYREYDAAELALIYKGGAETLPAEFHQWLGDAAFDVMGRYMHGLWADGVQITGDPHDEMTSFTVTDDVELRPDTYMVAYVCGQSWGGISTDKDGHVFSDGSLNLYRRTVWFTKERATLDVKIEWIIDESGTTCAA